MTLKKSIQSTWEKKRIAITGASGSLGMELAKELRSKGAFVIGLTHSATNTNHDSKGPNDWIEWSSGKEHLLENILKKLDILILNHGINPGGSLESNDINKALEINSYSTWRLIELFEKIALSQGESNYPKEIWVNISEAEIQPALSPSYEISKRLIGQLVSLKRISLYQNERSKFKIRKLILGPFRSKLNPIGIMNPELVAKKIITKAHSSSELIIVSPNPLTYFLMPFIEGTRSLYYNLFKINKKRNQKDIVAH